MDEQPTCSTALHPHRSYFSNSELASSGLPQGRELELLERYRDQAADRVFTRNTGCRSPTAPATTATGLRQALDLLRQAGWEVKDRKLVNPQAASSSLRDPARTGRAFERVALPYVQGLQRLGMEARVRTVDPAQYQVRTDTFDFDMAVGGCRPVAVAGQRAARLLGQCRSR